MGNVNFNEVTKAKALLLCKLV